MPKVQPPELVPEEPELLLLLLFPQDMMVVDAFLRVDVVVDETCVRGERARFELLLRAWHPGHLY